MARNIWNEDGYENDDEFRDNVVERVDGEWQTTQVDQVITSPQESVLKGEPSAPKRRPRAQEPAEELEEMITEVQEDNELDDDDDSDFSEVLSDARLRLEAGRLYEMVMNHNIFEGLNADPVAIKKVQKEIRRFAKERMEMMLGMKQEAPKHEEVRLVNQFNDLEVELLKQLTYKMSQGKTAEVESEEEIKPAGLNRISVPPKKELKKVTQKTQSFKKQSEPIKRTKNPQLVEKIIAEEGVTREELELDYKPLSRPFNELSDKEQAERMEQTKQRIRTQYRKAVSDRAVPMPSPEQQEAMIMAQNSTVEQSPLMRAIMTGLNNKVKSN